MAILKNNKHLSSNRESFKNLFANNWIIAIIINALIAFIFIVICCYFCVRKKSFQKNKNSLLINSNQLPSNESPYFIRRNLSANSSLFSLNYDSHKKKIFTLQPDNIPVKNEQNLTTSEVEARRSSAGHRFQNLGKITARLASKSLSRVRDLDYIPKETTSSFQDSTTNSPAIYNPPKEFNMLNFKPKVDKKDNDGKQIENRGIIKNNGDSGFEDQIVPTAAESVLLGEVKELKEIENMEANFSNMKEIDVNEVNKSTTNDDKFSKAVQTSPSIWFEEPHTVDLKKAELFNPNVSPSFYNSSLQSEENHFDERNYFIYLITESNPYFIKNCIGKINLPFRRSLKLSELRDILLKAEDPNLHEIFKKNRSFRFLTETYRFVSQNETSTSIDQIYPTQGIFIKLTTPNLVYMKSKINKNIRLSKKSIPSFTPFSVLPKLEDQEIKVEEVKKEEEKKSFGPEKNVHTNKSSINKKILYFDAKKICENLKCDKKATLKCQKCNNAYYCSFRCKKENYQNHRIICAKPIWKF